MKNSVTPIIACSHLKMHRHTTFTSKTVKFGIAFSRYCLQLISIVYISIIGKATMRTMKVKFQEETLARILLSLRASVSWKIKYLCQAILPCDPAKSKV